MSTLAVNSITDANAGNTATINGATPTVYNTIGRNLVINGGMQIAQRGTQSTGITTTGFRTVDRFRTSLSSLGTWTEDQSTDAPDGFANSFKLTCTTADASPAAGDVAYIRYMFEGFELQGLAYGTSSAKPMTLSFWVKSNKTGSASVQLLQNDNSSKNISPSYTINSADTWEYKTISIPADTAGNIDNDNGPAVSLIWWLNAGTDFTSGTTRTTWTAYSAADSNPANLGVGGATSDYFQITGVQLEVGSVATPFERRPYGTELSLCQRYYYKILNSGSAVRALNAYAISTTTAYASVYFPVQMRSAPSALEQNGTAANYRVFYQATAGNLTNVPAFINASVDGATISGTTTGLTAGNGANIGFTTTGAYFAWSAEL